MLVVTAEQMRAIDREAIEARGIPSLILMENAGRAVARAIAARISVGGISVVVVAGSGNNGGDGCVVARLLGEQGARSTLLLAAARERLSPDARVQLQAAERAGVPTRDLSSPGALEDHTDSIVAADVLVDALLGTGSSGELRGHARAVVERMNAARGLRVAVDLPSGLSADTGEALGVAFRPDLTVTLGYPKVGLVSSPGFSRVGQLEVADIGFPPGIAAEMGVRIELLDDLAVRAMLPARDPTAHKGSLGHLLLVAGSPGKIGAAVLAAEAAMRTGVGLCTVACPTQAHAVLQGRLLEAMAEPLEDTASLTLLLSGKRALAFGPGVPETDAWAAMLDWAIAHSEVPVVVDASGLNLLATRPKALDPGRRGAPLALTPHPGEAARLSGTTVAQVQSDRVGWAREFAARHRATVALKGARTVIAAPDGRAWINPTGNAGMATGGAGDVLLGVVGAFLCQGVPLPEALVAAVYVHGRAGDLAREKRGQMGLIARDLVENLPAVLRGWNL